MSFLFLVGALGAGGGFARGLHTEPWPHSGLDLSPPLVRCMHTGLGSPAPSSIPALHRGGSPQKATELSPREQDTPQRKGLQEIPHSCNLVPSEIYAGPVLSCYAVGR